MLMHEWIRYRNRKVKSEPADEAQARPEESAPAGEPVAAEEPVEQPAEELRLSVEAPEAEAAESPAAEGPAQVERQETERTDRDREEVIASLQEELERAGHSVAERLRQLQARQKQLPIEIEETAEEPEEERPRRASETRQELVQRLLDPTLTLREAALLLDVCPATVRRYTNRGLLKCFRTPGNQRRFRLSDVLDFMERREQGEV